MVDITLSSDRIRQAPIEVRRWIENELAESLGTRFTGQAPAHHPQLIACTREELERLFELVRGMPPVVAVLVELGRSTTHELPGDVTMASLAEISDRAHLQCASQVVACLKILNEGVQELRNDEDALLCAIDEEGRCYVATATRNGIHDIWRAMVSAQARDASKAAAQVRMAASATCAPPYSVAPSPAEASNCSEAAS